jgi:hypothetical protein
MFQEGDSVILRCLADANPPAKVRRCRPSMKETPRRRISVTSSLNEISKDKMGNRFVEREEAVLRLSTAWPEFVNN